MNKKMEPVFITIEETDDAIKIIGIDDKQSKVNKISTSLLHEINKELDELKKNKDTRALVILSRKDDNFIVGADVEELADKKTPEEIYEYISAAHRVLEKIKNIPVPVVVGIHGNCLGGGLELALVADCRIASDSSKTLFGLPEVQLGLIPAAGGTHRLPRLIGLQEALPVMLAAKNIRVQKAKKIGLIDEIATEDNLQDAAIHKARELLEGSFKRKKRKKSFSTILLESTFLGRKIVFSQAKKQVLRQTYGNYPAAEAIIDSIEYGYKKGIQKGLEKDKSIFTKLVLSPKSKALMSIFFGMNEKKKNPFSEPKKDIEKLSIIGAGLMGNGIASVSTGICSTIVLKDVSLAGAAKGLHEIWKGLMKRSRSGALTNFERDAMYGKLVPTDQYSMLKGSDLVVEAVFEDLALKKNILKEVEAACDEKTIFASNTSALPIHKIAEDAKRPENVIGMHYFSPVTRMPLLEIIVTEDTSDRVVSSALDFGIAQGKTCIVVKDTPGFYTTRILVPYILEGGLLLTEGVKMQDIDRAMNTFGYPVGPITLFDEVGIDVGVHVAKDLSEIFNPRGIEIPDTINLLLENNILGKKNKNGLYRYDIPKKGPYREANQKIYQLFNVKNHIELPVEEIQQRISLMMLNEAVLCLQEGVISSPVDGNLGAILGLGFPPFSGGPFRYIDAVGASEILAVMEKLSIKYGQRFNPADLLQEYAAKGKKFHS